MVQKFVANYYQLKIAEITSLNSSKSVTLPRQIAMYLSKSLDQQLPSSDCQSDRDFNTLINSFLESLKS